MKRAGMKIDLQMCMVLPSTLIGMDVFKHEWLHGVVSRALNEYLQPKLSRSETVGIKLDVKSNFT